MSLLETIKPFVDGGFAIHWLHKKQKRPIGDAWQAAPVASLDDLRRTYVSGNNVGVRLGEPSLLRSGDYLHVFDIDIRIPDLADDAWAAFAKLGIGSREMFPEVQSGSGGESRHLYLISDKPFDSRKLAVSDGKHRDANGVWHYDWEIEFFGTGKQVVMAPSIHPDTGLPYRWLREFDFDELDFGGGPRIAASVIEALGAAETREYEYEKREPLTFEPGQLDRELDLVPVSDLDYDDWLRLGQALHHQFGGSQEGLDLWITHTKRSDKFGKKQTPEQQLREMRRSKWRSFGKYRGKPVTMATVRRWAIDVRDADLEDRLRDEFDDEDDLPATGEGDDFDTLLADAPVDSDNAWDGGPDDDDDDETDGKTPGWVNKLNRKHAVAFVEGKTIILTQKTDGSMAYGSVTDLHNFYENVRRATEKSTEAVTKAWMRHSKRSSYPNGIVFAPAGGPKGAYNHWKGFSVEPDTTKSCRLFLDHLQNVICVGNDAAYQWLIRWFAHMIQKPWEKPGTAVVLKGRKGTGKDTVAEYVGGLFPRHHTKIANAEHLYGKFNAHQEKTLLLHVEEGFWAGDKKAEGSLKYVITSEQVQIEPKGVNAFQVDSVLRVFISSNEDWVVPASFDERRFFVMNVGGKRDPAYYAALRHEMKNGGRAALLHYLQTLDLRGFDVRNPPMTEGLRDQKLQSLKNVEKWWYELLVAGDLPGGSADAFDEDDAGSWSTYATTPVETLRGNYRDWMREHRYEGNVLGEGDFARRLRDMLPLLKTVRPRVGGSRKRRYDIPPLDICRQQFEATLGLEVPWEADEE